MGKIETFRAPRDCWGINAFNLYVDDLGSALSARILNVTPRTLQRWRAGKPPHSACLALYWESRWGRGQLDVEADYTHTLVCNQLDSARAQLREAHAEIEALKAQLSKQDLAANDSYFRSGASTAMRHSGESLGR